MEAGTGARAATIIGRAVSVVGVETGVAMSLLASGRHGALDVPAEHPALISKGEDQGEHEQDHGDRAAVPELEALEASVEHVRRHRVGGVDRPLRW
jgi:hypothetical protein